MMKKCELIYRDPITNLHRKREAMAIKPADPIDFVRIEHGIQTGKELNIIMVGSMRKDT